MLDTCTRIIVPMDGTDASMRAATLANQLGQATGLPVDLIHVHAIHHGEATGMASSSRESLDAAGRDAGSRAFGDFADEVGSDHCHVLWGEAADEILYYAERNGPALIIMGRGRESTLSRLVMGSVSDAVLRRAEGPVTVVS